MIRSGGLFVVFAGVGIVVGTFAGGAQAASRPIFFIATGIGLTLLFALGDRLSYGSPSRTQLVALYGAILLEILLFVALPVFLRTSSARVFWLWALVVVGVHFLPMGVAFGPAIGLLGGLCILNAGAGLLLSRVPFLVFGVVDGLLKMAFGMRMVLARPAPERDT